MFISRRILQNSTNPQRISMPVYTCLTLRMDGSIFGFCSSLSLRHSCTTSSGMRTRNKYVGLNDGKPIACKLAQTRCTSAGHLYFFSVSYPSHLILIIGVIIKIDSGFFFISFLANFEFCESANY